MTSCAYRWGAPSRQLPGGHQKISIPIFKNKTQEPYVEVFFTNALLSEFERSKLAQLVDSKFADAILEGYIHSIEYLPAGPREGGDLPMGTVLASEYRIIVRTEIKMKRVSDEKIIWSQELKSERTYVAPQVTQAVVNTVNPLYNHSARRINIEAISKQMMNEIFSKLTENF